MTRGVLWCLAGAAAVLAVWGGVCGAAEGFTVWTPDTGEVKLKDLPRVTPLQKFAYARALAGAGQYSDAARELRKLVKAYPEEVFVEQAELAIVVCLWQSGRHWKAYQASWRFLKEYPGSVLVPEVEQMRLQIAIDLSYESPKRAIRILEEVLQTSKLEAQSADALRYMGDCYARLKRYGEARDVYEQLFEDYPKSKWATYAFYRMGYCDYAQGLRQMRDMGLVRRALKEFQGYLDEYQARAPQPEVPRLLAELSELDASYHVEVARFYERKKRKPDAAAIYYQRALSLYPDAKASERARERLQELSQRHRLRAEQAVREERF
jgi:outer membrane protein assembly factor BamD (BamD/ComL family)